MKKKSPLLTGSKLRTHLRSYDSWSVNAKETQLSKTFKFSNYIDALVFVARISVHAEILNHHPDIELSYAKVKVKLTTHSLKGITTLDISLLERIEKLQKRSV